MKVLSVSYSDGGGAGKAAYRLHTGLRRLGIDSRMLVQMKTSDDPWVSAPGGKRAKALALARTELDALPLRLYPRRQAAFSPALVSGDLPKRVRSMGGDLVHLHWVNDGFVGLDALAQLRAPIVWTLHDMWPFTGGCHYDAGCERYTRSCGGCPVLDSKRDRDLSRLIWWRKKRHWARVGLHLVTPSRWLAECAKRSSLFAGLHVDVIPNGIDTALFRPRDRALARSLLSLPLDGRIVLFGAMGDDPRKGFGFLKEALGRLRGEELTLAVFGGLKPPDLGIPCHHIGTLKDDLSLALLYAVGDVFVAPSLQDNLPNTVMESLACGTPVVAFDIGGMPDLIEHRRNGYLARPYEPEDLAEGIAWVLDDAARHRQLSEQARAKAENEFDVRKVAARYEAFYQRVCSGQTLVS